MLNLSVPEKIYTIGHSTRPINLFIELLQKNNIEIITDVRSIPYSRRNPHFNKEIFREHLFNSGIEYNHIPQLGGRREPDKHSDNKLRNKLLKGFADFVNTEEFSEGIKILLDTDINLNNTLMCAEADWRKCHRAIISDYLTLNGVRIIHINDAGTEEHEVNNKAKLINERLHYI